MSLPKAYINRVMKHMAERCSLLVRAKGGHFREGGTKTFQSS